jgi:NADPH:quinone reductase
MGICTLGENMKAVGYRKSLPVDDPESLLDLELPDPVASGRDLLVEIKAVSVNPVDTKVRVRMAPKAEQVQVLGFDAAGIVKQVGQDASLFRPGDEVYYAGSIARPGTNSQLHLVDERIVGRKPRTLNFAEAAALPLTGITAWELLFDRFRVSADPAAPSGGSLLVIGGAGGVGSILIQLARQLTNLTVIATASRPETRKWCLDLGAHHVIDHSQPIADQVKALGIPQVERIASLTGTGAHYPAVLDILAPQGQFGLIDDPDTLDAKALKRKSASLHWEFMFARPVFGTPDMEAQHALLCRVADMVDNGQIRTTLTSVLGSINAANLRKAHALIESGRTRGKIVLEGF